MKKLITLLFCLCIGNAYAISWRLNNNPAIDADFSTFQAAHDSAAAGDTIYVEGTGNDNHYGNITISKKLILIGPGYFLTENDSTYANSVLARFLSIYIQSTAPGTGIYGLYIFTNDGNTHSLRIRASNVIVSRNNFHFSGYNKILIDANVENVSIIQNYAFSIETTSNSIVAKNLLIANNYIQENIDLNSISNAIITNNLIRYRLYAVYNSLIKNNILYENHAQDVLCVNNGGNNVSYNLIASALITGGPYGQGNVGGVIMESVFVGYPTQGTYSTDGRWQLKPQGPAIGAGEGGIDCGIFGGALPYVLSGLPPVPRIYEAIIPTAGSNVSGLPVIIKAKAQN